MTDEAHLEFHVGNTVTRQFNPTNYSTQEEFSALCIAHGNHVIEPKFLEEHHIVPQSWQKYKSPDFTLNVNNPHVNQPDRDGLWDPREAVLCRTGHGNVHYWLVKCMRAYADAAKKPPARNLNSLRRWAREQVAKDEQCHNIELYIALDGMNRWTMAGLDLEVLTKAKRWGGMYG